MFEEKKHLQERKSLDWLQMFMFMHHGFALFGHFIDQGESFYKLGFGENCR